MSFNQIIHAQTEKYRLAYRDDPATSVVVGWCGSDATVYYDTIDRGADWSLYQFNHGVDRSVDQRGKTHKFSRLTGLKPHMNYYFVVKSGAGVSSRFYFKTLSDQPNDTISFIAGGDTRTGAITEYDYQNCRMRRQDGNKLVSRIKPDFIAFSGDFILNLPVISNANQEFSDWFDDWQMTISSDGRMYPVVFAFGNHEDAADVYNMFDVPTIDLYYALSFGGNLFRLYSLNTELDGCTDLNQKNWLSNDLDVYSQSNTQTYWKIAQYHVPMVSHGEYAPRQDLISCIAPLFKDYRVNLAVESHAHVVKWTWPIVPSSDAGSEKGFIRDDANGTVFIGEGTWGAPLRDLYTANGWTRDQSKHNGFFQVCVSSKSIAIQNIKFEDVNYVIENPANAPCCTLPADVVLWRPSNGFPYLIQNPNIVHGINDLTSAQKSVNIYPNPASKTINVEFIEKPFDNKIEIYNAFGHLRKTSEIDVNKNVHTIDISSLPSGAYFIYVKTKTGLEINKVIIDK